MNNPKITVLMPVYNGEQFIRESISSILNQSFSDFELLIVNDGSTDNTLNIISSIDDKRIRIINNKINLKTAAALSIGIKESVGEYIARMDCDDISTKDRLQKQYEFMEKHPKVGICGSWLQIFGDKKEEVWQVPEDPKIVKSMFLFHTAVYNVFMRKEIFENEYISYDNQFKQAAEDYSLYVKVSEYYDIVNLPIVLLYYRQHSNKVCKLFRDKLEGNSDIIRKELILKLAINPTEKELELHNSIANWKFLKDKNFIDDVELWFSKIINANNKSKKYDNLALEQILSEKWNIVCLQSTSLGMSVWKKFKNSNFDFNFSLGFREDTKFFLKCLLKRESK